MEARRKMESTSIDIDAPLLDLIGHIYDAAIDELLVDGDRLEDRSPAACHASSSR